MVGAVYLCKEVCLDMSSKNGIITEVGTKSFTLLQRLVDTDTQEVKCIGRTIMVAYDLKQNKSMPMLPEWIDAICKFEGRDVRRKG